MMRQDDVDDIRGLIMGQIQSAIHQSFQGGAIPTRFRLVGDTPKAILDSNDYLKSILPFVTETQECVNDCRPNTETRFLALRIVSRHSFFVVDIDNSDYDYETAHEVTTSIPVYILRLSRNVRACRAPLQDGHLAKVLAKMHWGHGNDPLPLVDDCTKLVVYGSPRGLFS